MNRIFTFAWLCILLKSAAATLEDDGTLLAANCDTCTCTDDISCAEICSDSGVGKGRIEPFFDLLKAIGPTCSIFAMVQLSSELGPKDYCVSTIDNRPGWVIAQPHIGSYGLGVKEEVIVECWLRLWIDDSWKCDSDLLDGYHVYGAEVAPSPYFCGLPNLPAGLSLEPYDVREDTIRISLGYIDKTVRQPKFGQPNITREEPYKVDGHALVAVRYNSAHRKQSGKCYGNFLKGTWVTSLQGRFFGTDHDITGYNVIDTTVTTQQPPTSEQTPATEPPPTTAESSAA